MTKERFFEIFKQVGIDEEWTEVVYGRFLRKQEKNGETIMEHDVEIAAQSWKKYGEEGGF